MPPASRQTLAAKTIYMRKASQQLATVAGVVLVRSGTVSMPGMPGTAGLAPVAMTILLD